MPAWDLKDQFISRLRLLATTLEVTQKIAMVIYAHGEESGNTILGSNTISRYDILRAISIAKAGIAISITNTACYSGHWLGMVDEIADRDTHVTVATKPKGKHFLYRSFSNRLRCGLYTSALIYDLQTNPGTSIRAHHRRVVQEVELVDHRRGQGTSKSSTGVNALGLWNAPIGHFIPTHHVTRTIADILTELLPSHAATRYSFHQRVKSWWKRNQIRISITRKSYASAAPSGMADDPIIQG